VGLHFEQELRREIDENTRAARHIMGSKPRSTITAPVPSQGSLATTSRDAHAVQSRP
jgi:hypothetical protein